MDCQKIFFQNKKNIVSFVLSLLVFFIHFRVFSVVKNADGVLRYVLDQLLILTKVAVPLFFVISGAMFYRDYKWNLTIKKWKNRFFSLCIPYLLWNTMWLILALLGNYTPLGIFLGGVKVSLSIENVLRGIFLYGNFEPFWFIYQLIVLTALCPVIYLLLRNKWAGLVWIFLYYVAFCFGFELNSELLPNSNMVLFYLIGAWIGIHHFSFFASRKNKIHAVISFSIYILCCIFHVLTEWYPNWCFTLQIPILVTVISCGAFWISFDYFDMQKCPRFMSYSFLIYTLHSFVGAAVSKILSMFIPSEYLLLTVIFAFISTIIIICTIGWILDKYSPKLKQILTGR